jgi:hypothetical protein
MRETHLYPCVCVCGELDRRVYLMCCCLGLLSVSAGAGVAVPGRDPVHGVLGHWHCATTKICERQDLLPCACAAEPCWGAGRGLPQLQERRRCCRGSSHCCCLTWGLWLFKLLSPSDQQKEKTHQPTGGLQWPVKVRAQWSEWTVTSLVCFLLIFFLPRYSSWWKKGQMASIATTVVVLCEMEVHWEVKREGILTWREERASEKLMNKDVRWTTPKLLSFSLQGPEEGDSQPV